MQMAVHSLQLVHANLDKLLLVTHATGIKPIAGNCQTIFPSFTNSFSIPLTRFSRLMVFVFSSSAEMQQY